MPCCEQFLEQDTSYQDAVLPPHIRKRMVIEAGASPYWYRFAGLDGVVAGIDHFGYSAPAADVYAACGLDEKTLVNRLDRLLES